MKPHLNAALGLSRSLVDVCRDLGVAEFVPKRVVRFCGVYPWAVDLRGMSADTVLLLPEPWPTFPDLPSECQFFGTVLVGVDQCREWIMSELAKLPPDLTGEYLQKHEDGATYSLIDVFDTSLGQMAKYRNGSGCWPATKEYVDTLIRV